MSRTKAKVRLPISTDWNTTDLQVVSQRMQSDEIQYCVQPHTLKLRSITNLRDIEVVVKRTRGVDLGFRETFFNVDSASAAAKHIHLGAISAGSCMVTAKRNVSRLLHGASLLNISNLRVL